MLEKTPAAVGHALKGVRAGLDKTFWADPKTAGPETLVVTSAAFAEGGAIPARFTEDGAKTSPPLAWTGVPATAACVAIIVEDPDSPTPAPFVHLLAVADNSIASFAEGGLVEGAMQNGVIVGHNTMAKPGWLPPDPPTGHGAHVYLFQVYALDNTPELTSGDEKRDFEKAVRGHVVARGKLSGTYERVG